MLLLCWKPEVVGGEGSRFLEIVNRVVGVVDCHGMKKEWKLLWELFERFEDIKNVRKFKKTRVVFQLETFKNFYKVFKIYVQQAINFSNFPTPSILH